jgi:hypothetical protein
VYPAGGGGEGEGGGRGKGEGLPNSPGKSDHIVSEEAYCLIIRGKTVSERGVGRGGGGSPHFSRFPGGIVGIVA